MRKGAGCKQVERLGGVARLRSRGAHGAGPQAGQQRQRKPDSYVQHHSPRGGGGGGSCGPVMISLNHFQKRDHRAASAAITPNMSLDKTKLLAFTEQRLRELESWWRQHRDDV